LSSAIIVKKVGDCLGEVDAVVGLPRDLGGLYEFIYVHAANDYVGAINDVSRGTVPQSGQDIWNHVDKSGVGVIDPGGYSRLHTSAL
jgi:hypothetical protein